MCMRERSSLACAWAAKILTWLVSRSSSTGRGISANGRGATSWSVQKLYGAPMLSSSAASAAAISMEAWSVISVTFSCRSRHFGQRARGNLLERPEAIRRAYVVELGGQRGGNLDGGMVGNQRHFFVPLNAQANADRVARSLDERRLDGHFLQYLVHVAATCLSSVW